MMFVLGFILGAMATAFMSDRAAKGQWPYPPHGRPK